MITVENRIDQLFADRSKKRFIPFITIGDPSLAVSEELVIALAEAGADLIELGVAYSDPIADGPTIQRASQRALAAGVTMVDVMHLVSRVRQKGVTIPLVFFSYYNPVLQYGLDAFFHDLAACGADGIIIPDLPTEENEEASAAAKTNGVHLISLVAPTSNARISAIAQKASGFVYCVSSLGVTGVRDELPADLGQFLDRVKASTDKPIAVGFGISTPEQVRFTAKHADGVVVGSAIVREVEKNLALLTDPDKKAEGIGAVKRFVQQLTGALQ
ncbi:tryptophan synthase subunit alpha [Brevibacillus migulae]|uniref:tryptophan synthase subunit alpha n=1 Tax=Brevibacillus migulae TaxID=1644114 RepID=UPI00106E085B|nr:tryptophan synthase subunit alpha [Brevibacillus migulae]